MTSHLQQRGRVLRCVISTAEHGAALVAGTSTRLRPAYPGIGFSPDGGMSWTLPRSVGAARGRYVLLTNQVPDAGQALELGLVSVVVPDSASGEGREGVPAFLERRPPRFHGEPAATSASRE